MNVSYCRKGIHEKFTQPQKLSKSEQDEFNLSKQAKSDRATTQDMKILRTALGQPLPKIDKPPERGHVLFTYRKRALGPPEDLYHTTVILDRSVINGVYIVLLVPSREQNSEDTSLMSYKHCW